MTKRLEQAGLSIAASKVTGGSLEQPRKFSITSAWALDAFNFLISDVRDGITPFITLYLVKLGTWTSPQIGWVLGIGGLATLIGSFPLGLLIDRIHHKRLLAVIAALTLSFCAILFPLVREFTPVFTIQVVSGLAAALIGPAIAAISLGIVGVTSLSSRIGRNESFNYIGNFTMAAIAAITLQRFGVEAVFVLVACMGVTAATSLFFLDPKKIDYSRSRGFKQKTDLRPSSILDLLLMPGFAIVLLVAFLFQLANASQFSIATQKLAVSSVAESTQFVSIGLIVAQLSAIVATGLCGLAAKKYSAQVCTLVGLLAIAARAGIFFLSHSVSLYIAAQAFDGVAAGVLAVTPVLSAAKVTHGSGRFALAAALVAMAISAGASLSMVGSGYLMSALGTNGYFAVVSLTALVTAGLAMTANKIFLDRIFD